MFGFDSYTKSCLETHMGLWCVDDLWANAFVTGLQNGMIQSYLAEHGPIAPVTSESDDGYDLYGSTAVVPLVGSLSPRGSKFGGGSTLGFRQGLRAASRDPRVSKVMAYINSPGGVVEGTREAAQDLARIGEIKPTHAHIQDMGTSAAYYIASQAQHITANESALVGNIGVRSAIVDSSKAFEMGGIKVHLLATGPYKAIGVPGTEVTESQVDHVQGLINQTFELFADAVQQGRGLGPEGMANVLNGKTFMAKDALSHGLIDAIGDAESVVAETTGGTMAAEHEQQSLMQSIGNLLTTGKLKIVAEEPAPKLEMIPGQPLMTECVMNSGPTYEEGVAEGVKAAREEVLAIVELYAIAQMEDGLSHVAEAIAEGKSEADVRRALTTHRALRSVATDKEGKPVELNTTPPVNGKAPTVLEPVRNVMMARDRIAGNKMRG